MDVPLSPLTPNVILIRKDMCVRGEQFLGWTYFHLEIKAVTLTTLGRLFKKKSQSKKAHSADMSELRNFCFDSFGTSEILYTERF